MVYLRVTLVCGVDGATMRVLAIGVKGFGSPHIQKIVLGVNAGLKPVS